MTGEEEVGEIVPVGDGKDSSLLEYLSGNFDVGEYLSGVCATEGYLCGIGVGGYLSCCGLPTSAVMAMTEGGRDSSVLTLVDNLDKRASDTD